MKYQNNLPILLCALMSVTVAGAQPSPPPIFKSSRGSQAEPGRGVKRNRTAAIDFALFDRAAAKRLAAGKKRSAQYRARMRMDLLDNAPITVAWESAEWNKDSGAVIWTGRVEDQPLSHAVFVVGEEGVTGNVSRGDGVIYQIRPDGHGEHTVTEVDQKNFPNEAAPKFPPPAGDSGKETTEMAFEDDGKVIDVLVAYTSGARQAAGGESQMRQLIQLGIAETNQGYANPTFAVGAHFGAKLSGSQS